MVLSLKLYGLAFAVWLLASAGSWAADTAPFHSARLTNHLMQLQAKLPRDFSWTLQPPFVVIGDEAPTVVRQRSTNTVKWAVDMLKRDYFQRDPEAIIDVWLFKDKASYERWTRELFHDTPTTPFGYYSPAHEALIMNISTGGGTLVHEIVHPFMRANFPACPAWFNEGLASLYEQSAARNGRIIGLPNWRLPALQEAIRGGRVLPFEKMMTLPDDKFYGGGTNNKHYSQNYAQARYLCHYLQEQGLLVKFYKAYVADAKNDPSGVKTLRSVLGESDLKTFQKKWEKFVLSLRFAD